MTRAVLAAVLLALAGCGDSTPDAPCDCCPGCPVGFSCSPIQQCVVMVVRPPHAALPDGP